jgi:hypothetical protein
MNLLRTSTIFTLLLFLLTQIQCVSTGAQGVGPDGLLGEGTPFETPWYDHRGEEDGPTILITGGMHGNEPAGAAAAEAIASWTVKKGRLVVAPRMNPPALTANQRLIPGLPEPVGNLNRHFPTGGEVTEGVATDLWNLFEFVKPDWVLDIHEGFAFRRINSGSVGSSIIACADERATALAKKMIAAVDKTIEDEDRKFTFIQNPIEASFARAAWENAGVPSMILETTYGKYPLPDGKERRFSVSFRARQHRLMVHTFLKELGMEPCSPDILIAPAVTGDRVRVAIYDDLGTAVGDTGDLERVLSEYDRVATRRVCSLDVNAGMLSQFDVVLHPGGSGSGQANSLGELGRAKEVEFIRDGGGYLGVCAGGYLAACNYSWSLAILDARTIDTKNGHWRRGRAQLEIELTAAGLNLFGDQDPNFDVKYANGPIYAPGDRDEIPDYETLALYRGEVADNGTSKGVMPGTPALIRGPFGEGRAVAFSPHPEDTKSIQHFIRDAVIWASGGD